MTEMTLRGLKWGLAACAGACTWLWGGADAWMLALLLFILLDYMSGVAAAWVERSLSSRVGAQGILKKILILCLAALANRLDLVLGTAGALRSVVLGFYLANEGLSVIENAARCGVPVPQKLLAALQQLSKSESETATELTDLVYTQQIEGE